MDGLMKAWDEMVEKLKQVVNVEDDRTRVEILLDEHLPIEEDKLVILVANITGSNTALTGPSVSIPTRIMHEFASRSQNVVDFHFIMGRIWEVLEKCQQNPVLMKKTLLLLQFLLINGSMQVVSECKEDDHLSFIQEIAVDYNRYEFEKYQFSQHLDIGAGVRKLAADIQQLLNNDRELNCERKRAYKINKKLSTQGLRSGCNNNLATASFDGTSSLRPATYSDTIRPGSVDDLSDKIVTHKTGEFESDSEEEEVVVTSRSEKNKKRSNECEVDLLGLDTLLMSEPEAPHDAKISTAPPSSSSPSHNSFTRARQEKMVATI